MTGRPAWLGVAPDVAQAGCAPWRLGQVLESFPAASRSDLQGPQFFGRQGPSLLPRVQVTLMRDPRCQGSVRRTACLQDATYIDESASKEQRHRRRATRVRRQVGTQALVASEARNRDLALRRDGFTTAGSAAARRGTDWVHEPRIDGFVPPQARTATRCTRLIRFQRVQLRPN